MSTNSIILHGPCTIAPHFGAPVPRLQGISWRPRRGAIATARGEGSQGRFGIDGGRLGRDVIFWVPNMFWTVLQNSFGWLWSLKERLINYFWGYSPQECIIWMIKIDVTLKILAYIRPETNSKNFLENRLKMPPKKDISFCKHWFFEGSFC